MELHRLFSSFSSDEWILIVIGACIFVAYVLFAFGDFWRVPRRKLRGTVCGKSTREVAIPGSWESPSSETELFPEFFLDVNSGNEVITLAVPAWAYSRFNLEQVVEAWYTQGRWSGLVDLERIALADS